MMKILIHEREYEILDTMCCDWRRYYKIKVENEYEVGYVWKAAQDIKRNKFKDPMKINANGSYFGIGDITFSVNVVQDDETIIPVQLGSLHNKIVQRALHSEWVSDRNKINYKDTELDSRWRSYQNFARWVMSDRSNFRVGYQINKDLMTNENTYGPDSCVYLPPYLNKFLADRPNKIQPSIMVFKKVFQLPSVDQYGKYKKLCIVTMAKEYFRHGMINERIYNRLIEVYDNSRFTYSSDLMLDISSLIIRSIEDELKFYKPIKKFQFKSKLQRLEVPASGYIVQPSGPQKS